MNVLDSAKLSLSKLRLPKRYAPLVFLTPFCGLFFIFGLFPMLFSLYLAFQHWEPTAGLSAMQYVGLSNFTFALSDEWFWKSFKNTVWMTLASGIPQHVIAIPLACFIHHSFGRLRNLVVGIYFVPYITSTVAIAIMFGTLFSSDYGLINQGLHQLASVPLIGTFFPQHNIDWINNPEHLQPAIAMIIFWRYLGFNIVLYLAALQTIPAELYEAATMDGATRMQKFWHVTLPSLRPMIYFGVTLTLIGGLQLFEEPFILTNGNGGSDQAGMTSAIYLYRMAFDFNDFGAASAMSWILFVIIALLTYCTNWAFRERRYSRDQG